MEGTLNCGINPDNLIGLYNFQQEMLDKGNPSSETLNKVLGKEGARTFFEKVIMPVKLNQLQEIKLSDGKKQ